MGTRREISFLCLSWCQTVTGMGGVLRKGAWQYSNTGHRKSRHLERCEVLGKGSKKASKETGRLGMYLPDIVLYPSWYSVRPALSSSLWSGLQNNRHWEVNLTFVSKTGHLVRRASDEVQVIYSQMEKKECACPAKLGLTRRQVESSFLPPSSHCLFA